jgi:hypothetical protein
MTRNDYSHGKPSSIDNEQSGRICELEGGGNWHQPIIIKHRN